MTDKDKMPYGQYQGQPIVNVPAHYLIWLYDNGRCSGNVKQYIKDNLEVLRTEVKRINQYKRN